MVPQKPLGSRQPSFPLRQLPICLPPQWHEGPSGILTFQYPETKVPPGGTYPLSAQEQLRAAETIGAMIKGATPFSSLSP